MSWISFRLKEVEFKEDVEWYLINLDKVRLVKMKEDRIDIFDDQSFVTISKEDHPKAYETIRDFFLKRWEDHHVIVAEDSEDTK